MQAPDGTPLFESGALLLYLADVANPGQSPEQRGLAASWVLWANATFWPAMEGGNRAAALPGLLGPLDALLATRPYLAGASFGVADVAVASYVKYAQLFFRIGLGPYPALAKYMAGIEARPAFKATVAAG